MIDREYYELTEEQIAAIDEAEEDLAYFKSCVSSKDNIPKRIASWIKKNPGKKIPLHPSTIILKAKAALIRHGLDKHDAANIAEVLADDRKVQKVDGTDKAIREDAELDARTADMHDILTTPVDVEGSEYEFKPLSHTKLKKIIEDN